MCEIKGAHIQNMKSIKLFKYYNTFAFEKFLCDAHHWVEDIKGFKFGWKEQHRGNFLKVYEIYFNDGEYKLFRIVFFRNFNEYDKARLGAIKSKLLMWYDDANIRKYKVKDAYLFEN